MTGYRDNEKAALVTQKEGVTVTDVDTYFLRGIPLLRLWFQFFF